MPNCGPEGPLEGHCKIQLYIVECRLYRVSNKKIFFDCKLNVSSEKYFTHSKVISKIKLLRNINLSAICENCTWFFKEQYLVVLKF